MGEGFASLLPDNKENEKKFISYIISNPEERYEITPDLLRSKLHQTIYACIDEIENKGKIVEPDILLDYVKRKYPAVKPNYIRDLIKKYDNFSNMDHVVDTIKDHAVTHKIANDINKLSESLLEHGLLDKNLLRDMSYNLSDKLYLLESDSNLKNASELMETYAEVLKKRDEGVTQRSLGFGVLNRNVVRPAAPGYITGIVGQKGSGKSIFVKAIENILLNEGTCVVSFNPEMEEESSMDRLFCMRRGFSIDELLKPDKEDYLKQRIEYEINNFKKRLNYQYFPDADLNFVKLDSLLYKSKQKFKQDGVLPEDEYIFVVIDLLEMLEEWNGAKPEQIKSNMNKLHSMARKHRCHFLIVLQANENKWRGGKIFKNPEDLDYYKIGLEDVEGASTYAQRCRVMLSLNRPLQLKKMFFPERMEDWEGDHDLINISCIKANEGPLFFSQFGFEDKSFRIFPYSRGEVPIKEVKEEETLNE